MEPASGGRIMKPLRILILEDEPLVAFDLESVVAGAAESEICVSPSIAEARRMLAEPVDFALLDVDVRDGKSFDLAKHLEERGTPFVFVTGSKKADVPAELRHVDFISKPYHTSDIERVIRARAAAASNDNARR